MIIIPIHPRGIPIVWTVPVNKTRSEVLWNYISLQLNKKTLKHEQVLKLRLIGNLKPSKGKIGIINCQSWKRNWKIFELINTGNQSNQNQPTTNQTIQRNPPSAEIANKNPYLLLKTLENWSLIRQWTVETVTKIDEEQQWISVLDPNHFPAKLSVLQ